MKTGSKWKVWYKEQLFLGLILFGFCKFLQVLQLFASKKGLTYQWLSECCSAHRFLSVGAHFPTIVRQFSVLRCHDVTRLVYVRCVRCDWLQFLLFLYRCWRWPAMTGEVRLQVVQFSSPQFCQQQSSGPG